MQELIITHSDGKMGKWGGDLGWFERSDLNELFAETIFQLPKGGIAGPIESVNGIHFFYRNQ